MCGLGSHMRFLHRHQGCVVCFFVYILGASASETWTNQIGNTITAHCCGITNGLVYLRKEDGCVKSYPLTTFLPSEQSRMRYALGIAPVPACIGPEWGFFSSQLSSATQASQCRAALELIHQVIEARRLDTEQFGAMQADYWHAKAETAEQKKRAMIAEGHWAERLRKSTLVRDKKGTLP